MYIITEYHKFIPLIFDIFPNKYILKSQLFVIKNLVILAKESTLDHSTKIVLQNKQIINVIIIDIVIFLLDIPIKIQNKLIIKYSGTFNIPFIIK